MTTTPHPLDGLLNQALIAHGGDQDDIDASRRRIEAKLADSVWREARHLDHTLRRITPPRSADRASFAAPAPNERATRDLLALSALVIRGSRAATNIAGLVNSGRIEPDGALVFACLLHLADRRDGAQFWWRFSAGAGKSTAALCLHLLHLQRGEIREADYWAQQAIDLDARAPGHPARTFYTAAGAHDALYRQGHTTIESLLLRVLHTLRRTPQDRCAPTGQPYRGWSRSLAAAVQRLDVRHDLDFGDIPRPDPDLAARLADPATR